MGIINCANIYYGGPVELRLCASRGHGVACVGYCTMACAQTEIAAHFELCMVLYPTGTTAHWSSNLFCNFSLSVASVITVLFLILFLPRRWRPLP